jgi:hypothetical protein
MVHELMNDQELMECATEWRDEFVKCPFLGDGTSDGMCFIVCAPLEGYLNFIGIEARMVDGIVKLPDGGEMIHYWLELPDGCVLDPTLDQFGAGLPAVYLGPPTEFHVGVTHG